MTAPTMPTEAADWILTHVLPRAYLASVAVRPLDIRLCPCQWGPTGHCQNGNHEKCVRTWGWANHGGPDWETHIVSRRGRYALAPVWRVGTPCRWLCPCQCHEQVLALFDPVAHGPGRASLTGGNNRISSTDRLRRYDEPEPALFDLAGAP